MGTANPRTGTHTVRAHRGLPQAQKQLLEPPKCCFRRSRIEEHKGATTEVHSSVLCSSKDDKVMHTRQHGTFSK